MYMCRGKQKVVFCSVGKNYARNVRRLCIIRMNGCVRMLMMYAEDDGVVQWVVREVYV